LKTVMAGHHSSSGDDEQHAGYGWLAFCVIGMVSSLTLYGIALEYATSGGRHLHEWSFVFVTTSIYAITAFIARSLFGEKPTEISKYNMLVLSLTSIASTFTSVRSLRYVIYPVQVLFKSCKPVPVMLFNLILGKRYKLTKYVNVIIITAGVGLFMGGGNSTQKHSSGETVQADTLLMGAMMLSVSLCFDGATGAYEDKLMSKNNVEPFDLMYNIQLGKAVISFCILVATNGLNDFLKTLDDGGFALVLLGLTGALGQVFVFVTISKFGALNCALIGLGRKILSLMLSFLLYGHSMNAFQTVGLTLSIVAMIANFYEKGGNKGGGHGHGAPAGTHDIDGKQVPLTDAERSALLAPDIDDFDPDAPVGDAESGRPPVYRDDPSNAKGVEMGNLKGSNNSNNNKKKEESLLDLLDDDEAAASEKQNSYSDLPAETTQEDLNV